MEWEENVERFTFKPIEKTINFNMARPTDYILNKHINMPKPLSVEDELECELRRRGYMKAFKEYEDERKAANTSPKNEKAKYKHRI